VASGRGEVWQRSKVGRPVVGRGVGAGIGVAWRLQLQQDNVWVDDAHV
jgi:hypothetical protein